MQKLLTPAEIAEYLGVKKSTIYLWSHQGYIPRVKLGNLVRFRAKDIDDWLDSKARPGRKTHRVDLTELGL